MRVFFKMVWRIRGDYSKAERRLVEAMTGAFLTSPASAVMLLVKLISC